MLDVHVLCLQCNFYCRLVIGFPQGNDDDNETAPAKKHPLPVSKGTSATIAQCSVLKCSKSSTLFGLMRNFSQNIVQVLSINLCLRSSCILSNIITTFIVLYIIAAFFPFCAPGCEIVAPPPKRQRCDTASELENHYYGVIILVITVFHTAFFKIESCFG